MSASRSAPRTSEAALQAAILQKWGADPRLRIWRQNTGQAWVPLGHGWRPVRMGLPGVADIIGIMAPHGRWLAIETKASGGRQRSSQKAFQAMVERMGGLYVLARDVETVDAALEKALR